MNVELQNEKKNKKKTRYVLWFLMNYAALKRNVQDKETVRSIPFNDHFNSHPSLYLSIHCISLCFILFDKV